MRIALIVIALAGCAKKPPTCDAPTSDHDSSYTRAWALINPSLKLNGKASTLDEDAVRHGIACFDQALALNPKNWNALWGRGKAHQALGAHASAIASFEAAYAIERTNPDVGRELMIELLEAQRFDEGLRVAEAVSAMKPADAGLVANLALAQLMARKVDKAKDTIAIAKSMAPTDDITKLLDQKIDEVARGARPQPRSVAELLR